jgi:hypothetical protein
MAISRKKDYFTPSIFGVVTVQQCTTSNPFGDDKKGKLRND